MRPANPFSTLYRHRDLVVQFTRRELEMRHKGSRLGHLWALLSPMMMLGLYLFVFGLIFGGKFGVLPTENFFDFALALFLGLSLFNFIAEAIAVGPTLIVNQPNFVKKVVFPLEIIPLSSVASSLYYSLLSVLLLLVLAPFSHGGLSWECLALPALIAPLAMMALGIAWALAAVGVFVRDINHVTAFISTAIMYGSAIVYAPSRVPAVVWSVLRFNPLLILIDQARRVVLWHAPIDLGQLTYAYLCSGTVLALGYLVFSLLRPYFAEVI